mgnify:CR=1 FL=1
MDVPLDVEPKHPPVAAPPSHLMRSLDRPPSVPRGILPYAIDEVLTPRPGKRMFGPPPLGEAIANARSLGERIALRAELAAMLNRDRRQETTAPAIGPSGDGPDTADSSRLPPWHFLNDEASWRPVGSRPGSIPPWTTTFSPKPLPRVTETPARLLMPPRRKVPQPPARPQVTPIGSKASARLYAECQHREERHRKLVEAALSRPSTADTKRMDDVGEFVARMVTQPLLERERVMRRLQEQALRPGRGKAPQPPKLTPEKQAAFNERLYQGGMARERASIEAAARRHIDERDAATRKTLHLAEEDRQEAAARLNAKRYQRI